MLFFSLVSFIIGASPRASITKIRIKITIFFELISQTRIKIHKRDYSHFSYLNSGLSPRRMASSRFFCNSSEP